MFVTFVQLLYSIYHMIGHANFVQRSKDEFTGNRRERGLKIKKYSGGGDTATSRFLDKSIFHLKDVFQNVPTSDESALFNKRPFI